MQETGHFVNEWHGQTTLHPIGLTAVLVLGAAMLAVPRRYATWPMIVLACFIPSAQRIVVASLDFDLLRVMLIFGTVRILMRNEWNAFRWRLLDWSVMAFATGHIVMGLIRVGPGILVNKLGYAYDAVGMYLLFRMLVRDWGDVRTTVQGFSLVVVPVAAAFAVEWATRRNVFAVFGGVNEITAVRDGRLRCQGAFSHPILAGVFWTTLLPLFVAQWWDGRSSLAVIAVGASLWIVFSCSSATPVTGVMFACIGGTAFFVRHRMRWIRWGVVVLLIGLHMSMKAPVWHLISRLDIVGGNSGYHRFALIDGAIRHWHEWWLIGSRVGTEHWGHHTFDVTNTYIVQGLHGGIWLLGVLALIIAFAFRSVGRMLRAYSDLTNPYWSWALGTSLFVHVTSFIVISYFGQINMLWYLLLAMIGSAETAATDRQRTAQMVAGPGWALEDRRLVSCV